VSGIRVLQLIASSRGGGASHVRDLALALDRSRFAVQVAMPEDGGNVRPADFMGAGGLPFYSLGPVAGNSPTALRRIRHLSAGVDILHMHGARAAMLGRLAWLGPARKRPRLVYTFHGFTTPYYAQPRRAAMLMMERMLAGTTDAFIAVCQAEREAALAAGICRPGKVRVVRNGVVVSRFQLEQPARAAARTSLGILPTTTLITTICRLDKPRDFDSLLRAFQQVRESQADVHCLIVGNGPLWHDLERRVQAAPFAGKVSLTGWRQDVPQLYAASDIFTLTTWGWEGMPISVLEAMAASRPVVVTDAGGVPEAVTQDETGLLVPRRDAAGLAQAYLSLARDQAMRQRMGQAGQDRATRLFTARRVAAEVMAAYDEVVKE